MTWRVTLGNSARSSRRRSCSRMTWGLGDGPRALASKAVGSVAGAAGTAPLSLIGMKNAVSLSGRLAVDRESRTVTPSTPLGRRHLLRHAASALAGTGLLLATGPYARAAQRRAYAGLPAIGQTVNMSLNAFGTSLAVPLPPPLPRLDFIGSIVVKVLIGGPTFIRLQTLDFTMEAAHPLLGKVTLGLPDIDVSPASILDVGPGGLRQTWLQSMTMTFERFGDVEGPLAFETTQPARASADLSQFPPPAQGTNPDGSPTAGAFLAAASPINFTPKNLLPVGLPVDLTTVQLQWGGVNEGQLFA